MRTFMTTFLLLAGLLARFSTAAMPPDNISQPKNATTIDFSKMPLYFIKNQGLLDEEVAFYVQGSDKTLYFTPQGITFALTSKTADYEVTNSWVVKVEFVGVKHNVKPRGANQRQAVISYFKGRPEDWIVGQPTFGKIVYEDLWQGIDLVYSGTVNKLKYEFVVKPGADPNQIRLAYRGVTDLSLKETGELVVTTPSGGFEDAPPFAYQDIDGVRVEVPVVYAVEKGAVDGNFEYSFAVGAYDQTRPLVLDPAVLLYCGFIGGSGQDLGKGIAVDPAGNAYVIGYTTSSQATFPVIVGPDLIYNDTDVFVAKVSADGMSLVYCGYIGGTEYDYGSDIAVDYYGNAYVTGYTSSQEGYYAFPVVVGPDTTHNGGGYDAFVAKVNTAGTALLYCGYIGGWDWDLGLGIAVKASSGEAFVVGQTNSTQNQNFPVLVGPDLTHNGYGDAFVAKVRADGTALDYCGYIGGSWSDAGLNIDVDAGGYAYLSGVTGSSEADGFPVIVGPDLTFNGGWEDAFVAKVNASGSALLYCGYIGGQGNERTDGDGIAVDTSGCAYVTGRTSSSESEGFPVLVGPDLTFNGGTTDAFVAKLNVSGSGLSYCGYIGGDDDDMALGIAVDAVGKAYVIGETQSTEASFPVSVGPDLSHNGGLDGFVAMVYPTGSSLPYCGYIGGSGTDWVCGVSADNVGNVYITGKAGSSETTFPVVIGPDLTYNGSDDAFVAKISYGCCIPPIRGNVDYDPGDNINVADLTYLVDLLFRGGPPPPCPEEGDVDGSGSINIADLTYLSDLLFRGGPPPPPCP